MATICEAFGPTAETITTTDNLLVGGPVVEIPITVVDGQAALSRGQVLGKVTASGKYAVYDDDATDGTEVAAGILVSDIPEADGGDVPASMYVMGQFNVDAVVGLTAPDSTAKTAGIADLRAINVYLVSVG